MVKQYEFCYNSKFKLRYILNPFFWIDVLGSELVYYIKNKIEDGK